MANMLDTTPPGPQPARAAETVPDVVIFIPGLNQEFTPYPLEEFSLHLADALDNTDPIAQAKFRVGDMGTETLAKSSETQAATIFREHDGQETPVIKVFGMNYTSEFLGPYRDLPPLVRFLLLPLAILALPWHRILFVRSKSLSKRERLQFGLLTIVLMLVFAYALLLGVTTISSVRALQADPAAPGAASAPASQPVDLPATGEAGQPAAVKLPGWALSLRGWLLEQRLTNRLAWAWDWGVSAGGLTVGIIAYLAALSPTLNVWATALGLLIPTRSQLLQAFDNGATILVAMIQYHWLGSRRPRVRGQLTGLVQDILEAPETANARIHILAYSFGSVVALDTLFRSDLKAPALFGRIHSLVTVGSPFDLIQWMWPSYFQRRQRGQGLRWINVFAPQDILSSNFLNKPKVNSARGELPALTAPDTHLVPGFAPDVNLVYRPTDAADELSLVDVFRFVGLSSHNLYWERGKKRHSNAFDLAITEMFPTAPPALG